MMSKVLEPQDPAVAQFDVSVWYDVMLQFICRVNWEKKLWLPYVRLETIREAYLLKNGWQCWKYEDFQVV